MGEYIEREKFAEKLKEHLRCTNKGSVLEAAFAAMLQDLEEHPSANVSPMVHGEWVPGGYACGETEWKCSVCNETEWRTSCSRLKYCPFCGAKMDGGGSHA